MKAGAPAESIAVIARVEGPLPGFGEADSDWLLYFPLSAALTDPCLGVDQDGLDETFLSPLLLGGFVNDPEFGGSGPVLLPSLAFETVYATLIPESGPTPLVNASADGISSSGVLAVGEAMYLPEPSFGWMLTAGSLGLIAWVRRRAH